MTKQNAAAEDADVVDAPGVGGEGEGEEEGAAGEGEGEEEGEADPDAEGDDDAEGEGEDDDDEGAAPQGKPKRGLQARFDKMTGTIYSLREENAQLRQMMEKVLEQTKPAPPPLPPRPKHADFDTDEEYEDAVYEWRKLKDERDAAEKNRGNPEKPQGPKGADGQAKPSPAKMKAYQEQASTARGKYADFDQVVNNPAVQISDAMVGLILDSDNGAEVAYYLGKHPEEAARIAQLPPSRVGVELGKLEAKLEAAPAPKGPGKKPAPQPSGTPKPSNAPKPMTPIGGKAPANRDPAKMSMEEYAKWANEKERKKGR